jgi:hypothetical protein
MMSAWGDVRSFCERGAVANKSVRALPTKTVLEYFGHLRPVSGHLHRDLTASAFISLPAQSPVSNCPERSGQRHLRSGIRNKKSVAAVTLVEALIALGIMVLFVCACLTTIVVSQVSVRKAKEEAIAIDFLTKYTENVKALPFGYVTAGQPINLLYNGTGVAPLIAIPANGTWVPIDTADYQTFYPDLLWFNNRNPKMLVTLTKNTVGGVLHDIEINVRVDWDPPISKGGRQEVQVDFLRTKDVTQL